MSTRIRPPTAFSPGPAATSPYRPPPTGPHAHVTSTDLPEWAAGNSARAAVSGGIGATAAAAAHPRGRRPGCTGARVVGGIGAVGTSPCGETTGEQVRAGRRRGIAWDTSGEGRVEFRFAGRPSWAHPPETDRTSGVTQRNGRANSREAGSSIPADGRTAAPPTLRERVYK
jgi:hypothetical protein